MARGIFIAGTDTGVGKTLVSQAMLRSFVRDGLRAVGMKPVASGCEVQSGGMRSADALALLSAGNVTADYTDVNPYAFRPATAPHLAAKDAGVRIDPEVIQQAYRRLASCADLVIVEGVGGWLVPVDGHTTMADVVRKLDLPVILVVGLRLGAINHALLAQESIRAHHCRLTGWVANHPDGPAPEGYLQALSERLEASCLGVIPPDSNPTDAVDRISGGSQHIRKFNNSEL